MRGATARLPVLLVLAAIGCDGMVAGESRRAVIGGTFTSDDLAVVAVLEYDDFGDVVSFCSGALISPHVVVTAAHCLHGGEAFSAYFGSEPFALLDDTFIDSLAAVDVAILPQFIPSDDPTYLEYDLGVIALEEPAPVPFIPIQRLPLDPAVDSTVRLVGFGRTAMGIEDQGVKREVMTTLERVDDLRTYFGTPTASTCNGDSGSPQLVQRNGGEMVVSVDSGGEILDCSGASVGYRMDAFAASFLDPFIREHDAAACSADGLCASDCGDVDPDCPCAPDGMCTEACPSPAADPDCSAACPDETCDETCPPGDPSCSPGGSGCAPGDPDCQDSQSGGGCAMAAGSALPAGWLLMLAALVGLRLEGRRGRTRRRPSRRQ